MSDPPESRIHHRRKGASPGRRTLPVGAAASMWPPNRDEPTLSRALRVKVDREENRLRQERSRKERDAIARFRSLFDVRRPDFPQTGSAGEVRPSSGRFHPDNEAAFLRLATALGVDFRAGHAEPSLNMVRNGDVFLVGGPKSTGLTRVAWEFEGDDEARLTRPAEPILKQLRWYGVSDESDIHDTRIGWRLESVGPVAAANWPLVDTKTKKRYRGANPSRNSIITASGEEVFEPKDNWLIVTRLPNFLADLRSLPNLDLRSPDTWPGLLVFEGAHGLGTRAAELLLETQGQMLIEQAEHELRRFGMEAYQLRFEVKDLEVSVADLEDPRKAVHRFARIDLLDIEPLEIPAATYMLANEKAVIRLGRP
jgi:hypothetical protein